MIILFTHILLAFTTVIASILVFVGVRRDTPVAKKLTSMWSHFAGVVVTGAALVIMMPGALGHACLLVSVYIVLTAATQVYATRRAHLA